MASDEELTHAIVTMLEMARPAPPVVFANHDPDEVAALIGAVVNRCQSMGLVLVSVAMGSELADIFGLKDGSRLKHGGRPLVRGDFELGRQVRFEIA
ncbi:hypothetical protein SB2_00515 [Methylobacterium radiotolerans]|nr:hypothetical protein SB3_14980 [Methylobacterium radiotolerans]KTS50922.1 hypothetical protein SB2_00515 [Methylobacterium radiotolerans]